MNTSSITGRAAHSASTGLAVRAIVQGLPQASRGLAFESRHVALAKEIGTGYPARSALSEALFQQQQQMAQDLRDLGMHEGADRIEERLGLNAFRRPREH